MDNIRLSGSNDATLPPGSANADERAQAPVPNLWAYAHTMFFQSAHLRYNARAGESMQKLDFAAALRNNHGELAHAHWTPDRSRVEVLVVESGVPKIDHLIYL